MGSEMLNIFVSDDVTDSSEGRLGGFTDFLLKINDTVGDDGDDVWESKS